MDNAQLYICREQMIIQNKNNGQAMFGSNMSKTFSRVRHYHN
jgi:hypothetical protein